MVEKLRSELLEEAMSFIEDLIHREKEKQNTPGIHAPYNCGGVRFKLNVERNLPVDASGQVCFNSAGWGC